MSAAFLRKRASKPQTMKQPETPAPSSPPNVSGLREVRFQLDAAPNRRLFIAGTFNNWNPTQHQLIEKNGSYSITLNLAPDRYEYKFIIDDVWCVDPECPDFVPNEKGTLNSVLVVK